MNGLRCPESHYLFQAAGRHRDSVSTCQAALAVECGAHGSVRETGGVMLGELKGRGSNLER